MNIVLYFQYPGKSSAPMKLEGVRSIADKVGWMLRVIDDPPDAQLLTRSMEFWQPIGCIVDCGGNEGKIDSSIFQQFPTVYLDGTPSALPDHAFSVSHDSRAIGTAAAHELMLVDQGNFVYIHPPIHCQWSDERKIGFENALKINGKTCRCFVPQGSMTWSNTSASAPIAYQQQLRTFLKTVPMPCSIFAANDRVASEVLEALAALRTPSQEYSIIGVDNFVELCEHTNPKLTSIESDFYGGGITAALMLLAILRFHGDFIGKRQRTFGPKHIVRRSSTRLPAGYDAEISAALELIENESCQGLTAAKVLKVFKCSRNIAATHFRKATGRSILEAIHERRLRQAKELLANPFIQLKSISDFCGFETPNALQKFFRKATGMNMSAWREEHMGEMSS